jgi:hypothetical protein
MQNLNDFDNTLWGFENAIFWSTSQKQLNILNYHTQ